MAKPATTSGETQGIPNQAIHSFVRAAYPALIAYYESESGKQAFAAWKAQKEQETEKAVRACLKTRPSK